jgi:ATP-dependent Clp protease ATP-binding subunit ClpX
MERAMMEIMYHLPSRENVIRCFITRDTIENGAEPVYTIKEQKKTA